jgi:putative ABC transport system permease protein
MSALRQVGAVTLMNLRSLPDRLAAASVVVIGIAGVVAVLVSVLAMATGFTRTLANSGRADRAIVLRAGSDSELASSGTRENALTITDAPGIRRDRDGKPIASAEAVVIVGLPKKGETSDANVTLRGVGPEAFALRPEIRIVAGRMFEPALREVIVGKSAQAQFAGLEIGSRIAFRDSDWTVVGIFESGGDAHESELMADAETVLSAYRRNGFQTVTALLDSPEAFETFKHALTTDPTLSVDVKREPEYYAQISDRLATILFLLAYFVGGIMAIGAVFGALNTMYSAVSARTLEIATLRAIGFGAVPVVVSVLAEALFLALLGGAIGAALAWFFFNGNLVSTLGGGFTQVVFRLTVTPGLIALGIIWAAAIGLLGGLFPAIRAARLPVAEALRAG